MAESPEEAVVGIIDDAAITGLTRGTNLLRGPVRDDPALVDDLAVFCLETGGPAPISCVAGGQGPDLRESAVQIVVRSNRGEYAEGKALAESVWKAVQRANRAEFVSFTMRESSPIYLIEDDGEHHRWSLNVATVRED